MIEANVGKLSLSGWYLEEEKKTEETISHLRRVLGTFVADSDPICKFMEGYLAGIKSMHRRVEEGE